jgi:hypothetical protein
MNRKRKVLTVAGLACFAVVMGLHYVHIDIGRGDWGLTTAVQNNHGHWGWTYYAPVLPNVQGLVFALGVLYMGVFALLGGADRVKVAKAKAVREPLSKETSFWVGFGLTVCVVIATLVVCALLGG